MSAVAWFLQIPPNPCSTSSPSSSTGMSRLSSLLRRSGRPSGQDEKPPRTVSWNTHIEVWRQPSRSVTWSSHVEVFVIPARERAPRRTSYEDEEGIIASSCEDDL